MFKLRWKYNYRHKKYVLRNKESDAKIGMITYSNKDIIVGITALPMLSAIGIAMIFGNIYCGIIFGIIHLLIVLYSALEID